jgi:GNAT superfamily N-acetyltransferase
LPHPVAATTLGRMATEKKLPRITVRNAASADVPCLVAMNQAAYPDLVEENVVWNAGQLHAHLARFPEGQLVAELDRVPIGAISTFVVPPQRDPLAPHTWLEITNNGTFASHDRRGDTLYLADIYVDPRGWGKGVGETLYAALRDLCVTLDLRRVVAGGRLWGYHEYAARMSAEEYVARVLRGEIRDRVLGSQIKAGFAVRGLLVGYLHDARSRDYATLLEWLRPAEADRDRY